MAAKSTKAEPFEKAIEKLEKVVTDLESGDLSLEQSIKAFEAGTKLASQCEAQLQMAQQKVELLLGDKTEPFPWEEDDG